MRPLLTRIDHSDPRSRSALGAEKRFGEMHGLEQETLQVELPSTGARVRVTVTGSGDPIVILPGGSGEAFPYMPLIEELKGWHCIAINRPGGGLSDGIDHRRVDVREMAVEVVDTVLAQLGVSRAAILCNSMGGLWGFWYALRRPERVTALVELGCPALALGTSLPFFMRLISVPGLGAVITRKMQPPSADAARAGLRVMGTPREVTDSLPAEMIETAWAMFNLPTYPETWQSLIGAVATVAGANPRYALSVEDLCLVKPPVLLVWGRSDPFGALSIAQQAAALIPSCRLVVLGKGHLPFVEDPAGCAQLIREHLASAVEVNAARFQRWETDPLTGANCDERAC